MVTHTYMRSNIRANRYASSPAGTDDNATYEAMAGVVTTDVYATVSRGNDTPDTVPDYVHGTTVDRKKAEAALRSQGLVVGSHILRTKKAGTYVMTMCTDPAKETFAHHVLQRGTCVGVSGFSCCVCCALSHRRFADCVPSLPLRCCVL